VKLRIPMARALLLGATLVFFGSGPAEAAAPPLVGVKIYDPVPDPAALFREWKRLGIDTAFVSAALAESGTFLPAARQAGFRTFVITPVFFNPEYLAAHPDAWPSPVAARGRSRTGWSSCARATRTTGRSGLDTRSRSWRSTGRTA